MDTIRKLTKKDQIKSLISAHYKRNCIFVGRITIQKELKNRTNDIKNAKSR